MIVRQSHNDVNAEKRKSNGRKLQTTKTTKKSTDIPTRSLTPKIAVTFESRFCVSLELICFATREIGERNNKQIEIENGNDNTFAV
jgi:hypothetical protein